MSLYPVADAYPKGLESDLITVQRTVARQMTQISGDGDKYYQEALNVYQYLAALSDSDSYKEAGSVSKAKAFYRAIY